MRKLLCEMAYDGSRYHGYQAVSYTHLGAPGLGLKTAQRIILELKDKITKEQVAGGIADVPSFDLPTGSNASEAISALVVLGYGQGEAAAAVTRLDPNLPVEELIKHGLKALAGKL